MSRVGKRILNIPNGTEVSINNSYVEVKGPKGTLSYQFSNLITIANENNQVTTTRANEDKHTKQLHGTTNSLIAAMIKGVSEGFTKEIEIKGVGYKATLKGEILEVIAGYSHPVNLSIPSNLQVSVPKPTQIIISGIDKQAVGQFAAIVRDVRRPSPYSGKGIMYKDEVVRRKEGKTASK
ncbi:50S ribosomal protein L6 [Mycoplasma phocoenae]|uniref:Large ribosomal subunit protein uL6 n=1 Tax=Mycoplasma phocoenae TaxID=754517 RepID=A0A858U3X6_9MOLU|nr:50S ribosomal protein L6 [Mycoplasma phocoenae]QJG67132.1 50S ribosomal protein L6 [Mycoplasma phocoenae]